MPEPRLAAIRLIVLTCCILTYCSAQDKAPGSALVTNDSRPDSGTVSGNVYLNSFFDLTFEFPKGWIPHGEATKQHLMEIGKDKLVAAMPGSESALRAAEKRTYNLLTVFENELGTPGVRFFRSEVLIAEDVSWAPGVKTGKDYLLNVLPLVKKEGYDRFSEIKEVGIGGRTYYREDLSKQLRPDIRAYQAYFATIVRGYALSLVISTEDSEETDKLAENPALHFGPKLAEVEAKIPPERQGIPSDPRESASIRSGLYHNNYFDLDYQTPDGWFVDTEVLKSRLRETTTQPSDPTKRIVTLLAANEFAPGTPGVQFNPSLTITAYNASHQGRVMKEREYLSAVTLAAKKYEHAEVIQQDAEVAVGSQKFYRADYSLPDKGYKTVLCTDWRENIIAWTFVGRSQSQTDDLARSIHSVLFSAPRTH